jgi:hypothetical protein
MRTIVVIFPSRYLKHLRTDYSELLDMAQRPAQLLHVKAVALTLKFVTLERLFQTNNMKIYIGTDHAGYELKEKLKAYLTELGHTVEDKGPFLMMQTMIIGFYNAGAQAVAAEEEVSVSF